MNTTTAPTLNDLRRRVAGKRRTATCAVTWRPERRTGTDLRVSGHAAVFDSESVDLGFTETLAPGCFANALTRAGSDPYLLLGHDTNAILARRSAGTLELREDTHGLRLLPTPSVRCAPQL
jgi:phage head maturation protease